MRTSKRFHSGWTLVTVALLIAAFFQFAPASIIQAVIPQVVPTANRQGSTGTTFFICTGSFTAGDWVTTDANGNCIDGGVGKPIYSYGGAFVNGGSNITTAISVPVTMAVAGTIKAWNISINATDSGTATVKFLKIATGTASPGTGNSINTSGVSLSSGTSVHSTTVTDFTTTAVAANDILAVQLTAVSGTVTGLSANIQVQ